MKKLLPVVLFAFAVLATGCTFNTSNGGYTTELTTGNFKNVASLKKGTACRRLLFNILPIPFVEGETDSVVDAIKEGKISKVVAVDQEHINYVVIGKRCTYVYGN